MSTREEEEEEEVLTQVTAQRYAGESNAGRQGSRFAVGAIK